MLKLKPPSRPSRGQRTRLRALAAAGTATLGLVSSTLAQATPALADPTIIYNAVGADTTQDVMNQYALDLGGNEIGSWNAVNPVSGAAHETIAYTAGKSGQNCDYTRPNGSTEGWNAFRRSINLSTTAPQLAIPPQAGCIDISRSSIFDTTDAAADGQLVFIPFALEAVTTATGPAGTTKITTADSFTLADLKTLYTSCGTVTEGGVTYNPGTATTGQVQINLYVPQSGSGTLTFWASTLGFTPTTLPACDHQTILAGPNAGTQVQADDGTAVNSDPNGMMPFSIAHWIAQSNGIDDHRHGAVPHNIGGVTPCTGGACPASGGSLNTAFPIRREVYNIVQYDQVVNTGDGHYDPNLASLLAGTNSALCQDAFTITGYGFATLATPATTDNCGATTNNLRAFPVIL